MNRIFLALLVVASGILFSGCGKRVNEADIIATQYNKNPDGHTVCINGIKYLVFQGGYITPILGADEIDTVKVIRCKGR